MSKNILRTLFATDDGDERDDPLADLPEDDGGAVAPARPRSLADAWEQLARQSRRVERRLEELHATQKDLVKVAGEMAETAQQQLEVLHVLGKFHEASEKRGRQMENAFQGVPDVLRTLPSATREQAEKLSEIAARLYEKAQDNTVNALKAAQANHQRAIENMIEQSLGAGRRLTWWSMVLTLVAVGLVVFVWISKG